MDDAKRIELQGEAVAAGVPRRKPGPRKKEKPRDEKISCRLTKEEKAEGEKYCREHGITEAKLLRASYLATVLQPPGDRFGKIADLLMQPFDMLNLPLDQKLAVKEKIREILKKSAMLLLLVLLGCAAAPTIAKYVLLVYETGKSIVYGPHQTCIYHIGENGCEMVPDK